MQPSTIRKMSIQSGPNPLSSKRDEEPHKDVFHKLCQLLLFCDSNNNSHRQLSYKVMDDLMFLIIKTPIRSWNTLTTQLWKVISMQPETTSHQWWTEVLALMMPSYLVKLWIINFISLFDSKLVTWLVTSLDSKGKRYLVYQLTQFFKNEISLIPKKNLLAWWKRSNLKKMILSLLQEHVT